MSMPLSFSASPSLHASWSRIAARYGIQVHYQHNLVSVDGPGKTATFEKVSEQDKGERITVRSTCCTFLLPEDPPDEIKSSPLSKTPRLGRSQPEFNATRALPQRILTRRCQFDAD